MIAPEDRGFTLGDGLFETLLADGGELKLWDPHMARLNRGCEVLGLPLPEIGLCLSTAKAALAKSGLAGERAAVRLSWSAGVGGRGLDRPEALAPRLTATVALAHKPIGPVRMGTVSVRRNDGSPTSKVKSLSYLDNILARREAQASGVDEALMLNTRGALACASLANLFWLERDVLFTPALDCGVLDGIMRGVLIDRARGAGVVVQEVVAGRDAIGAASALFLTNSLIGVRSVGSLDGRAVGSDPMVQLLAALVADVS